MRERIRQKAYSFNNSLNKIDIQKLTENSHPASLTRGIQDNLKVGF